MYFKKLGPSSSASSLMRCCLYSSFEGLARLVTLI